MKIFLDGKSPDVYNVGNPSPEISITELAEKIRQQVDRNISVDIVKYPSTYPEDEPNRRCPDISRIESSLGYKPKINLDDGLLRFFTWAKENYSSEYL
jgi:UDP-glucuronate decarboxylase